MTKKCKLCGKEMELELFEKDKRAPDGHSARCLDCARECKRVSAVKHHDERIERKRKYREEHPEEYKAEKHDEYIRHRTTYRAAGKKYYEENKEWFIKMSGECRKRKYEKDPTKALADILRNRIRSALLGKCCSEDTQYMLGCSMKELQSHMESQFTNNMNWSTYGFYGWHSDHVKPCAEYDLTDNIQKCICFNFNNLRPLWGKENMQKYYSWSVEDEAKWRKEIWPKIKENMVQRGIIDSSYEGC